MKHIKIYLFLAIILTLATACNKATVPATYESANKEVHIYPDYKEVTVPVNIAPLHFEIDNTGDEFVTRISYDGGEWVSSGTAATPDEETWRTMVAHTEKGAPWRFLFAKEKNGNVSNPSTSMYHKTRLTPISPTVS
jgi:hypothetical protein